MKGQLTVKVIRGATGRSGFHLVADSPTAHVAVQAFVLQVCTSEGPPDWSGVLESNPVAREIARDVEEASHSGFTGQYWRARSFADSSARPVPIDFGAPPPGSQLEGRYNPGGRRVLYLASDSATAVVECGRGGASSAVWVQEFAINLPTHCALRLDLDLESRHPHLHYLLLDCEYLPDLTADFPNVRNPYRATHFLSYLCERLGISAVEYPSVRAGTAEPHGSRNLVVLGEAVQVAERMTVGQPNPCTPSN